MQVYAGLYKVSCDMCGNLGRPEYIVKHKNGSKVDICAVCYGKCLSYPKFNNGVESKQIEVARY